MRIYVSGPSADISWCRRLMRVVESMGHEITFDWTEMFSLPAGAVTSTEIAVADCAGVQAADAVVLLYSRFLASIGQWVELGVAISARKHLIVVGRDFADLEDLRRRNPFLWHADLQSLCMVEEIGMLPALARYSQN